jgi:type IV/VI secretion system ImpK/VasF family protein
MRRKGNRRLYTNGSTDKFNGYFMRMNEKNLIELAENIFKSALLLPLDVEIPAEETKKYFAEKIKEFCNDCTNNGYTAGETENAKYALCAWIDEYIYANCSISAKWFSHSLVLSEFEDAEAGKHFFERMDNFHKNKNSVSLLELYTKCILFGFMGKFRMGETSELKQILNSAISKTDIFLEKINFKPVTKNKYRFSFRRGIKNILITGFCETQCKEAIKKQNPPRGYSYIYSRIEDYENLPFIDGIILINPLQNEILEKQEEILEKIFSKQKCKIPIYRVANLEIQEFTETLDKNYEFNSNHLNYYLYKNFLDCAICKNILSLPKKMELFKNSNAFYTLPFFPFMEKEKPLAYSLAKKVFFILFLASIAFLILFSVLSVIGKHKEEIKAEALFILQKHKNDSIKFAEDSLRYIEDSLNLEFESRLRNLELYYQKQILEKFPFKEGKIPSVAEIANYFNKEGEFYKFIDIIDTTSDKRIKFNKKTLAKLSLLKNNTWNNIPVSIIAKAPDMASVKLGIDSQYVEIENGKGKKIEIIFPKINGNGMELVVKTANNFFEERIKGEWSLLKMPLEFSFKDKSYLVDVAFFIDWHLPKNAIKPKDWFGLRLEPNLIENFSLTNNLGE